MSRHMRSHLHVFALCAGALAIFMVAFYIEPQPGFFQGSVVGLIIAVSYNVGRWAERTEPPTIHLIGGTGTGDGR